MSCGGPERVPRHCLAVVDGVNYLCQTVSRGRLRLSARAARICCSEYAQIHTASTLVALPRLGPHCTDKAPTKTRPTMANLGPRGNDIAPRDRVSGRRRQGGRAVTTAPAAREDTFPKLIVRNARIRPGADGVPAQGSRHLAVLDLGRGARGGARLCGRPAGARAQARRQDRHHRLQPAAPLLDHGGRAMARRRPGSGLCRFSVADEMAYVLAHAEVTHAAVQDQEQVDKLLVGRRPGAAPDAHPLRRGARPARLRPQPPAARSREVIDEGRKRLADAAEARPPSRPSSPPGRAPTSRSSSTPPARPAGRRA